MIELKRIIIIPVILCVLFLSGCYLVEEPVSEEYLQVEFLISSVDYDQAYTTFYWTGNSVLPVHHDASYEITFEYAGDKYVVDDPLIYMKYGDHVGKTVTGTLRITKYPSAEVKTLMSLDEIRGEIYE